MKRREFVQFLSVLSAGGTVFGNKILSLARDGKKVTRGMVVAAEDITGLRFTDDQRDIIMSTLQSCFQNIERIRQSSIPAETKSALYFLSEDHGVWELNRKKSRDG